MQDRFKFRVWCENNQEWEKDTISISNKNKYEIKNSKFTKYTDSDPQNHIINFCTGLKDKNGKLSYEGDIVKFLGVPCKIVFELGEFCIVRNCKFITVNEWYELLYADNWNDDTYSLAQLYFNTEGEENFIDKVEVIGNIYENTELLEVHHV